MRKPREVLVDAFLWREFDYNDADVEGWLRTHVDKGLDPYTTCADFTCKRARIQADFVIDSLESRGYSIVKGPPVVYVDGEAYDNFIEALNAPPRVLPRLRDALRKRGTLDDDEA